MLLNKDTTESTNISRAGDFAHMWIPLPELWEKQKRIQLTKKILKLDDALDSLNQDIFPAVINAGRDGYLPEEYNQYYSIDMEFSNLLHFNMNYIISERYDKKRSPLKLNTVIFEDDTVKNVLKVTDYVEMGDTPSFIIYTDGTSDIAWNITNDLVDSYRDNHTKS